MGSGDRPARARLGCVETAVLSHGNQHRAEPAPPPERARAAARASPRRRPSEPAPPPERARAPPPERARAAAAGASVHTEHQTAQNGPEGGAQGSSWIFDRAADLDFNPSHAWLGMAFEAGRAARANRAVLVLWVHTSAVAGQPRRASALATHACGQPVLRATDPSTISVLRAIPGRALRAGAHRGTRQRVKPCED